MWHHRKMSLLVVYGLRRHLFCIQPEEDFGIEGTTIIQFQQVNLKYPGRHMDEQHDDIVVVERNTGKDICIWLRVKRILARHKSNPIVMCTFYKALVQVVILYGSDTWHLSDIIHKTRGASLNYNNTPNQHAEWSYPETNKVLKVEGLYKIHEYIERRNNTLKGTYERN